MSLRAKITLSYLAIIFIFLFLGFFVLYIGQLTSNKLDLLDQEFELMTDISIGLELSAHTLLELKNSELALHAMLLGETEAADEFQASISEFDEHLEGVINALGKRREKELVAVDPELAKIQDWVSELSSIQQDHEHFHEDAKLVIAQANDGNLDQAKALMDQELDPELEEMDANLAKIEESIEGLVFTEQVQFEHTVHEIEDSNTLLRILTTFIFIFSLIFVVLLSAWMSRQITHPINDLSGAAISIEEGNYMLENIDSLANRQDEFGPLARVFLRMAAQVHIREQRLKEQVQQLQIKIDRKQEDQQVAEITETDFFKRLEAKASKLRGSTSGSNA